MYHRCPRLEISECQLESFRSLGLAGNEALCGAANCTGTSVGMEKSFPVSWKSNHNICHNQEDLPTDVLANRDYQYASTVERACCNVDTSSSSSNVLFGGSAGNDTCVPQSKANPLTSEPGFIGGMSALAIMIVGLGVGGGLWYRRRRSRNEKNDAELQQAVAAEQPVVIATQLHVIEPPTNPACAPMEYSKIEEETC